jgi:hypothetical protein
VRHRIYPLPTLSQKRSGLCGAEARRSTAIVALRDWQPANAAISSSRVAMLTRRIPIPASCREQFGNNPGEAMRAFI